jgi:hypothetical protein
MPGNRVALVSALIASLAVSCSSDAAPEREATTSCSDYLASNQGDRDELVRRVATELGVANAIGPLVRSTVDNYCSQNGEKTLGDAIQLFNAEDSGRRSPEGEAESDEWSDDFSGVDSLTHTLARDFIDKALTATLSYRAGTFDRDTAAAEAFMTPAYRKEYQRRVSGLRAAVAERDARQTAEIVTSTLVSVNPDRFDYLTIVNTKTVTNAGVEHLPQYFIVSLTRKDEEFALDGMAIPSTPDFEAADPVRAEIMRVAIKHIETIATYGPRSLDSHGDLSSLKNFAAQTMTAKHEQTYLGSLPDVADQIAAGVERTVQVQAAGVEGSDDGAGVLVAGPDIVTVNGTEMEPRTMRAFVFLVKDEGTWLVDNLQVFDS